MDIASFPEELPTESETGMVGRWMVKDDNGETWRITGRFLGSGSSRKPHHRGHAAGTAPGPELKCGACRWLEMMIFQELDVPEGSTPPTAPTPTGNYFVVKVGATEIPKETDRYTVTRALSADEVVVAMSRNRTLTRPAAIALARAAGRDEQIREAYRAAA